jgi:hypothetical protein
VATAGSATGRGRFGCQKVEGNETVMTMRMKMKTKMKTKKRGWVEGYPLIPSGGRRP